MATAQGSLPYGFLDQPAIVPSQVAVFLAGAQRPTSTAACADAESELPGLLS